MRISKWLVLACALSMLFMFSMSSAMLVRGAEIPSGDIPNVITKTEQFGVPAAFLEWNAHQLIEVEGTYHFTGKSPVPFTGLSVGWLVSDHTADPRSFTVSIRSRKDEAPWMEWIHFPGNIGPAESPSGLFWSH